MSGTRTCLVLAAALGLALGAACTKDSEKKSPGGGTLAKAPGSSGTPGATKPGAAKPGAGGPMKQSPAAAKAWSIYYGTCKMCHGENGKGDGPTAANLKPPPRNYTDKAWQKTVTDADLKKIILEGGAKLGKSPVMPASPGLAEQPEVLDELVKIIRGFAE